MIEITVLRQPDGQLMETPCRNNRCISFRDSACRCFGYMVSKKKYIFTIDDDCFVAKVAATVQSRRHRNVARRRKLLPAAADSKRSCC